MLLITDFLLTLSDAGKFIPMPRGHVTATPSTTPLFLKNPSGSFQEMELPTPVALSDSAGKYSLTLPWPSESNPSTVTWQITMPDGTIWAGTVPEGQVGPLTINTLKNTYGWTTVQALITNTQTPSIPHPFIWLPDGWDATWKAAKTAATTTPTWITCFQDSVFNGVNQASAIAKTVHELLITSLLTQTGLSRYADYWPAMQSPVWQCPSDSPWGPALNSATFAAFEAGFHKSQYCNNINNIATTFQRFTSPYACTALDIVYVDFNAGVWAYSIDGGAFVNVTNTGTATQATVSIKKIALSGLPNAIHTIDFRQTSSGTVLFGGVSTYAGSSGIGMVRMSCSGQRAADYVTGTPYPADRIRLHMGPSPQSDAGTGKTWGFPHGPSLLILGLGINDCNSSDPLPYLEQFYNRIIHAVRSLSPACSVLIWIPHYPYSVTSDCSSGYANQEAFRQYQNEMVNVAHYWGCALVNNNWKWGETPFAQGFLPATDLHPKDAGQADIATTLLSIL